MDESKSVMKMEEPMIIYRDILIPLMSASGFEFVYDMSDNNRYHARFLYQRRYIENDLSSAHFGQYRLHESHVDVIAIPILTHYLILHGIVVNSVASDSDDIRMKLRCQDGEKNKKHLDEIRRQLQGEFVRKLIDMISLKIGDLPSELKVKIMSYLPLDSLVSMSQVNSEWNTILHDEQLWKAMVMKVYPHVYYSRQKGQSWKALFKEECRRRRLLRRRQLFAQSHEMAFGSIPALPSSEPLLPIAPPPFLPMLPAPPSFYDLVPFPALPPPFAQAHDPFREDFF